MNTFTKISATALFALFLTACDKPADNATAPANKAEQTQTADATKDVAKSADEQSLNDFKKLMEWKAVQEQNFANVQKELEQHIAAKDQQKLAEAMSVFSTKVGEIVKDLETLEIKSPEINTFKMKAHENLTLLGSLIIDSVKGSSDPKPELQSSIQEKTELLKKSTAELKQIQTELEQKYLKKQ